MVGTSIPEIAINQAAKLEQITDNYDRLANRYQEDLATGDIWYLADFYKYFEHLRTLHKRMNRCSAGTSYVNVDLKGDVHLCHRFTADVTQKIGHISGDSPNVPETITRRDQLAPVLKSVPSGTGASSAKSRSLPVLKAGGNQTPIFIHHQLDGQRLLRQEQSHAGAINVCSICDIRYLCGGACFHDGEILFGDLHGGPDGFKCEVDRHLAKIGIWLLDGITKLDGTALPALDELHRHSIQHTD
jgi:sulfatase maturation enzyme AslB (radical SAM superfamily)